jgi:hypothetical protein
MKNLKPDISMAQSFLKMLAPEGVVTFQTFDDSKIRKSPALAHIFHGRPEQHFEALAELNQQGAGVFVMVNRGDGVIHEGFKTCRTAGNVTKVRALFADLDGSPLQPLLDCYEPDIVVESSPGKWHAYYLTDDCPLDEFPLRQKQIAQKFNSDPSVHDLPRVMRLPGFFHQKDIPFMSRVISPE